MFNNFTHRWLELLPLLCCPCCKGELLAGDKELTCVVCRRAYPILDGVPVLINEANSLFSLADFTHHRPTTYTRSNLVARLSALTPNPTSNFGARQRYARLEQLLSARSTPPTIVVIGGAVLGKGFDTLLTKASGQVIETDVTFGPRTQVICDAHDIPFKDASLDAVIAQAVLEHIVDPYRCVSEIHRVLKPDGMVYAETPFMQQVHAGRFDFTRFTYLGHRRLFRYFAEIESGVVGGPGTVLAWSYEHLWLSFAPTPMMWYLFKVIARLTGFWLKYLDLIASKRPGVFDCASGYYFMGRRVQESLADKDLITLYKGSQM